MKPTSEEKHKSGSRRRLPPEDITELRLVVFSDAFRHRNGVGAYYDDLLGHLGPRLSEAELVCPGNTTLGKKQGISIPLPGDRTQRLCLPGLLKARHVMRTVRPHVMVIATPGPYGMLGVALAKWYRTPLCIGYHTQYDKLVGLYWHGITGGLSRRYLHHLDRILFRRARVVLTNSFPMFDAAKEMNAHDVRLMGTPIEPRLLAPPVPLQDDSFGPILFVGRLAAEKNLDIFLQASKDLPNLPFVIAGDGPEVNQVKKAAENLENLTYKGWVDRKGLVETLDASEMLVLPSKVEAFGTVAIEAMARERLTLVSEHCGIAEWPELASGLEILRDGETLTEKLRSLASLSPEERYQKRMTAREKCLAFVEETVDDWGRTLLAVARGELLSPKERQEEDQKDSAT